MKFVREIFLVTLVLISILRLTSSNRRRNDPSRRAFYSNSEVPDELMQAVYIADVKQVDYLLTLDPEIITSRPPVLVNRVETKYNRTSIMVCGLDPQTDNRERVDQDCRDIGRLLFRSGASLTHRDIHGWDALSMGAVMGFTEFCEFLLQRGVQVDGLDENNRTALMKATAHAHLKTIEMLLRNGADLSLRDINGQTMLHHAVLLTSKNDSFIPFFQKVLSHHTLTQVDNFLDKDKRNVLMYAAIENSLPVVRLLLDFGCDPRKHDKFLLTAPQMTTNTTIKQLLTDKSIEFIEREHANWVQEVELEGN